MEESGTFLGNESDINTQEMNLVVYAERKVWARLFYIVIYRSYGCENGL
jgi:hypothetical protein